MAAKAPASSLVALIALSLTGCIGPEDSTAPRYVEPRHFAVTATVTADSLILSGAPILAGDQVGATFETDTPDGTDDLPDFATGDYGALPGQLWTLEPRAYVAPVAFRRVGDGFVLAVALADLQRPASCDWTCDLFRDKRWIATDAGTVRP